MIRVRNKVTGQTALFHGELRISYEGRAYIVYEQILLFTSCDKNLEFERVLHDVIRRNPKVTGNTTYGVNK